MIKLLSILLLSLSFDSLLLPFHDYVVVVQETQEVMAQPTPLQYRISQLFHRIWEADGRPQVELRFEKGVNAFTVCGYHYIDCDPEWLSIFTDIQIMAILGHELSHCHPDVSSLQEPHACELAADLGGIKLLHAAGYSKKQLLGAAEYCLKLNPDTSSDSHPSGKERYNALVKYINNNYS